MVQKTAVIAIPEKSSEARTGNNQGGGEFFSGTAVPACREITVVARACRCRQPPPLITHGRHCGDIDQASYGIAAVESGLRSPQHLHRFDVGKIEIVTVLIKDRNIVHVESNGRLVHARTYATHIHR